VAEGEFAKEWAFVDLLQEAGTEDVGDFEGAPMTASVRGEAIRSGILKVSGWRGGNSQGMPGKNFGHRWTRIHTDKNKPDKTF
jgi:hypothetical protein